MIPLYDDQPTRSFPLGNLLIIVVNALVFIGWQMQLPGGIEESVALAGFVPSDHVRGASGAITHIITSVFMHAGWLHLIGNMWFLWLFGRSVESACGFFEGSRNRSEA